MGRPFLFLMAPLALLVLGPSSRAEQIIVVQSVVGSSTQSGSLLHLIDGSGLSGNLHDTLPGNMWLGSAMPATVTFGFDGPYWVSRLEIWNYNASVDRGAKNLTVLAAADAGFTPVADHVLNQAPGNAPLAPQVFTPTPFQARSVRLELTTSYGALPYVGLSEVQLFGSPVPEPSTLVGLLGMGLLGAALAWQRMRRRACGTPH